MNYFLICHGLGGNIKESARKGLERGAKKIQKNAKILTPVDTGTLRNSIKTNSEITQDGAEAQVYTNLNYAAYVNFRHRTSGKRKWNEVARRNAS
jgi:phage gpG-like protein